MTHAVMPKVRALLGRLKTPLRPDFAKGRLAMDERAGSDQTSLNPMM
jgi:hypothetical protein